MTSEAARAKAASLALLDDAATSDRPIPFWWRDDDAVEPTPALDRLVDAARTHNAPLALAVIPKPATEALATRLEVEPLVSVHQHGYAHTNHADKAAGEKASEFGESRALAAGLAELKAGFDRLQDLFGPRFHPVLTPPWNRIGATIAAKRGEAGLIGLSTFGTRKTTDPTTCNTHLDVIAWRSTRGFIGEEKAWRIVEEGLRQRRATPEDTPIEPFGLLTHHLVHDEGTTGFIENFLALTAHHPGAIWPKIPALFNLS